MSRLNFIAIGLVCVVIFAGPFVAMAEDAKAEEAASSSATERAHPQARRHILTDIPDSSEDVDIAHVFPDHPNAVFPAGEKLKVLMGMRNTGDTPMNVTHLAGSINAPQQWNYYVTNFTVGQYNVVIEPAKEASFEYQFYIDPQLAGHEFTLALTAFFHDGNEMYASTFFNNTIPVIDPPGVLDTHTMFMYLNLLAILGAGIYFGLQATGALAMINAATKKKAKKEMGTSGVYDQDEWLQDTSWTTFGKASKRTTKKKVTKK